MDGLIPFVGSALVITALLVLMFLPTFFAIRRNHSSFWGIVVANVVFGWMPLFWIFILIWSLSGRHPPERSRA
ncbi:superinfection immunity protein [Azospirillum lipoferum]|uniref:superinfection immunity protein n=1 Tax=Azospirillum lipoferum TaxID=193 RepID=UPI0005C93777|nr:superinfection immunity protein [Azospirillum lipoferum]